MIKRFLLGMAEAFMGRPQVYILEQSIMARELPAIISRALKPDRDLTILDIGCGPARYARLFNGSRYIGIDMEERYVRFAQKRHRHAFARMDATALGFKDCSFDYVLIAQMLHHVSPEGLKPLVREARRVLKDDGRLVVIDMVRPPDGGSFVSNFLVNMDRGTYIREATDFPVVFGTLFTVQKVTLDKMGFYTMITVMASKPHAQESS